MLSAATADVMKYVPVPVKEAALLGALTNLGLCLYTVAAPRLEADTEARLIRNVPRRQEYAEAPRPINQVPHPAAPQEFNVPAGPPPTSPRWAPEMTGPTGEQVMPVAVPGQAERETAGILSADPGE